MRRLSIALCSLLAFMPLSMRADSHIDDWRNPPDKKRESIEIHLWGITLNCEVYQDGNKTYEEALNSTKNDNSLRLTYRSLTVEEIEENMRYLYYDWVRKDLWGNPKPPEELANPRCDYLLELM